MPLGRYVSCAAIAGLVLAGCATARFYDEKGERLPGLPFVWKDAEGRSHLAYVRSSTGFGSAAFSLERKEDGGYVKFSNDLDSRGATQITGDLLDRVFEAGVREGRAQIRERILRMEDAAARGALLRELERPGP